MAGSVEETSPPGAVSPQNGVDRNVSLLADLWPAEGPVWQRILAVLGLVPAALTVVGQLNPLAGLGRIPGLIETHWLPLEERALSLLGPLRPEGGYVSEPGALLLMVFFLPYIVRGAIGIVQGQDDYRIVSYRLGVLALLAHPPLFAASAGASFEGGAGGFVFVWLFFSVLLIITFSLLYVPVRMVTPRMPVWVLVATPLAMLGGIYLLATDPTITIEDGQASAGEIGLAVGSIGVQALFTLCLPFLNYRGLIRLFLVVLSILLLSLATEIVLP